MKGEAETILEKKRVRLHVLGCRSNIYEAEAIASALAKKGGQPCGNGPFHAAVVVSCMVTGEAERKCRQLVRRLKREEPEAPLVVCGCWAQFINAQKAREIGIDALVGNRRKHMVPEVLEKLLSRASPERPHEERVHVSGNTGWDPLFLETPRFHTRAFVKVQDGCDHGCTYCIIPAVRGAPVSRDPGDTMKEVRNLAAMGIREVVLTGTHLGLYGKDRLFSLKRLVEEIDRVDGIDRVRFGSLEPFGLEEGLLEGLAASRKFCPHLHLPLQSGDDRILSKMGRGCRSSDFLDLARRAKNIFGDDIHISTDAIVGFPGEDDDAFNRTIDVLESSGVGKIHAFRFSPRQGTPATEFPDRPDSEKVKARMKRMLEFAGRRLQDYASRWEGKRVPVLVERCDGSSVTGYTPHFVKVLSQGSFEVNGTAEVEIRRCREGLLEGHVCYNSSFGEDMEKQRERKN